MRKFPVLLILTFTLGCATRNIKFDRIKILKKYSTDYEMFVDNEKINLETVFLDKDNIENVRIDKRTSELNIHQIKPTEFFEFKNLNLDSLSSGQRGWNKKKIDLIIVDGIPLTDSLKNRAKIDPNAIKSLHIISEEMMKKANLYRIYDGNILVITTK